MVNSSVRMALLAAGVKTVDINLFPKYLAKSLLVRSFRLFRVFPKAFKFYKSLIKSEWQNMYVGMSGGYGQLYDCLFVGSARIVGKQIFLHHHNYTYLNKKWWLSSLLFTLAGHKARHVVLCEDMAVRLSRIYNRNSLIVSNAIFVDKDMNRIKTKKNLKTLGFLGNITHEKGISEFLDVVELLKNDGLNVNGKVAGPFHDQSIKKDIMVRMANLGNVEYIGPIHGDNKSKFFNEIDLLIFPTKYRYEAQPLTIYEAMSNGVPVIASNRGCIKGMMSSGNGLLVDDIGEFPTLAFNTIKYWISNPKVFELLSIEARANFVSQAKSSGSEFKQLIEELIN